MRYGAAKFADHSMELSTRKVIAKDWIDLRVCEEVDIEEDASPEDVS